MAPRATKLATTGASVNVSNAAPPTAGQALVASSATTAVWGNPGGITTTADILTDNSTGTAGVTLAAGVGVYNLTIPVTLPVGGAGAADQLTTLTLGHKFKILAWQYVEAVAATGSGGSRVYNMEIGTTDVGTSASTITITTASAAVGRVIAGTAVSGANTGSASATLSIEVAASGTTHDAGSGAFVIRVQNMDTADAIASIAAEYNEFLADATTITP